MTTLLCPRCGASHDAADVFCPKCGLTSPDVATLAEGDVAPPSPSAREALLAELREALAPQIQVIGELGGGGMGTVFLGRDPSLKRSVAIKVLNPELAHDEALRARFAREAEAAAAVGHPNVIGIYQVGTLPGSGASYFVMQFVEGETLVQVYPPGTPAPVARVRRIVGEVADALAAAHARGLVHRDIKPANVMLERETGRTLVLDFGISAVLERRGQQTEPRLTATGSSLGTPTYMSPEQASAEPITGQTDVYSLGCMAFELLAGRPPFVEASTWAVMAAHIKETPPSVQQFRSDVDAGLAELVDSCLKKDPAQRPTAAAMARQLLPPPTPAVEWPPPGLARLHRSGMRVLAVMGWNGLALAVCALLVTPPAGSMGGVTAAAKNLELLGALSAASAWSLALLVSRIAGGVFGLWALILGIALGRRAAYALQSGYPLRVALAVAFDALKDTSALLNGEGVYADLAPAQRERASRWRRRAALLLVVSAVVANLAPLVWLSGLWPGSSPAAHAYALDILVVLLPSAACLLAAWYCARRGGGRRRRRQVRLLSRRARPRSEVVRGWLVSRGVTARAVGPARATAVGAALALAPVLLWLCAAGTALVVTLLTWDAAQWASVVRRDIETKCGQDFAECALSTAAAESALTALVAVPPDTARQREATALVVDLLDFPRAASPDSSAGYASTQRRDLTLGSPRPRRAWAFLSAGLPPPLRDSLVRDTADIRLILWRAFAALRPDDPWWPFDPHFLGSAGLWDLQARGSLMDLAARNEAAAVLAAGAGDTAAAIRRLRENLAAGRNLAIVPVASVRAQGHAVFENASVALRLLARVARGSGAAQLAREADSVSRRVPWWPFYGLGVFAAVPGKPQLQDVVRDPTRDPRMRYGLIANVATRGFCYSPREMIFGISPDRAEDVRRLATLAKDLPRIEAFSDLTLRTLDTLMADGGPLREARENESRYGGPIWVFRFLGLNKLAGRAAYCMWEFGW